MGRGNWKFEFFTEKGHEKSGEGAQNGENYEKKCINFFDYSSKALWFQEKEIDLKK